MISEPDPPLRSDPSERLRLSGKEAPMGNRDQRSNKEKRKPKQAKVKAPPAASSFIVTPAKTPSGGKKD
jgi:hypothetical protein